MADEVTGFEVRMSHAMRYEAGNAQRTRTQRQPIHDTTFRPRLPFDKYSLGQLPVHEHLPVEPTLCVHSSIDQLPSLNGTRNRNLKGIDLWYI